MNNKILGTALFVLTLGAVIYYPSLSTGKIKSTLQPDPVLHVTEVQRPVVDVVFVLDTTGSMSGLIQTAKDKIWSIATTMSSAQPTPEIRIGLVGYRDRGDAYVTKVIDLSSDLDSVYADLMDFEAGGGGDTPESVNQALHDAVHNMSWSQDSQAYQVVFLVGDAPPHMDYQDEPQFPQIMASALQKGIVVNTIQCGDMPTTVAPWQQIADLGNGSYFQVEQAGSAVAYATPYDEEIAALSARLDDTRLYYGSDEEKSRMYAKMAAADKLETTASVESRARRGVFNSSVGGKKNLLGEKELVEAITSGEVSLDELDTDALPEALQPMAPDEQLATIEELSKERQELQGRIQVLARDRNDYIARKVAADGGGEDSLDQKLYEVVVKQSGAAGLEFEDGPAY
jgi:Mg-chelatase subunit ChlD